MVKKVIVISKCSECPHEDFELRCGDDEMGDVLLTIEEEGDLLNIIRRCELSDREVGKLNDDEIPEWCKLEDLV